MAPWRDFLNRELKEHILSEIELLENWTLSSNFYSEAIKKELGSEAKPEWAKLLKKSLDGAGRLIILDAGTGPGFFAVLLAESGHAVTAVDTTEAMIKEARNNAELYLSSHIFMGAGEFVMPEFLVADTANLPLELGGMFDAVVSRNLCWGLISPMETFGEWLRVLKPGGKLIIFDSNWNLHLFDPGLEKAYKADIEEYKRLYPNKKDPEHTPKMVSFRRNLPLTRVKRPEWDLEALAKVGYEKICVDKGPFPGILSEEEELLYRSFPMFRIMAYKPLG
jgi:SAM-dependent methyltransferase